MQTFKEFYELFTYYKPYVAIGTETITYNLLLPITIYLIYPQFCVLCENPLFQLSFFQPKYK